MLRKLSDQDIETRRRSMEMALVMTDDDRVASGKYLCLGGLACVFLWLLAVATHTLLVLLVPGCRTGAKGFPINCGWATDLIDLSSVAAFWLGIALIVVVPLIILGLLIWTKPSVASKR